MFVQPRTGFTIWLTGMQGAGKSTLARAVVERLQRLEKPVEFFEGPEWEQFIGQGPGETMEERHAVTRRAGFVARAITRAGGFAVVAQVSPSRELREQLRREIGRFLEVFVDCPFTTLLERDESNQYKRALRGEIRNFIGVTDPYEPPGNPEVRYDSSTSSVEEGVSAVLEALANEGVLTEREAGLARGALAKEKPRGSRKRPASILFTPEMLKLSETRGRAGAFPTAQATKRTEKSTSRSRGTRGAAKSAAKPDEATASAKKEKTSTVAGTAAKKKTPVKKAVKNAVKKTPAEAKKAPAAAKKAPAAAKKAPAAAKKAPAAAKKAPAAAKKAPPAAKKAPPAAKKVPAVTKKAPAVTKKAAEAAAKKAPPAAKKAPAAAKKAPTVAKKASAATKKAPTAAKKSPTRTTARLSVSEAKAGKKAAQPAAQAVDGAKKRKRG